MKFTCTNCYKDYTIDTSKTTKDSVTIICPGCLTKNEIALKADTKASIEKRLKGSLSKEKIQELRELHEAAQTDKERNAIKAALCINIGLSIKQCAHVLVTSKEEIIRGIDLYMGKE